MWYGQQVDIIHKWLAERVEMTLHPYQLTCLIHIIKVRQLLISTNKSTTHYTWLCYILLYYILLYIVILYTIYCYITYCCIICFSDYAMTLSYKELFVKRSLILPTMLYASG